MDKLKTYKVFEKDGLSSVIWDDKKTPKKLPIGSDVDAEARIDEVMQNLLKKKDMILMLGDTINYVSDQIKKSLPLQIDEFMDDLKHYDEDIYGCIDELREKMIDGYPNMKDMIEEITEDIHTIESYLKNKKI